MRGRLERLPYFFLGGIAQLGVRSVRIREVSGSNPLISTKVISRSEGLTL